MTKIQQLLEKKYIKLLIHWGKFLLIILPVSLTLTGVYYFVLIIAGVYIKIDINTEYQTMKGFGASSAWTFQNLGASDDEVLDNAVELLYGDSGLSLNIFRYNIGAGSAESRFNDVSPYNSGYFDEARRAESFFIGENYVDSYSYLNINNYDFTRDNNALKLFEKCLATNNIKEVVFFANSPHYTMTTNGKTVGNMEYDNNLREDAYIDYSNYLLVIVNYLYQNYLVGLEDVPAIYISAVNEPQWRWGGEGASQEGCHYDPAELAAFYDVFNNRLSNFNTVNNTNFHMDVFESGNYKLSKIKDYLEEMSKYDYFNELDYISVHSYAADTDRSIRNSFKHLLNKYYPDLSISMTEFCELRSGRDTSIDSGLFLGKVMSRDFTLIDATDWSWWLAISNGDYNDGLVYWDVINGEDTFSVLKRYYVMGHYSKYISYGDVRVDVTDSDFLGFSKLDYCAYKKADGTIVLVVINDGNNINVRLNGNYETMQTITTTEKDNWKVENSEFSGKINLTKKSITTIILK